MTKDKAIKTKKLIFSSALVVFYKKGFSSTTLEDIDKEAGVSRGAIYWNFKNKQDLYVGLLREYFTDKFYINLKYKDESNKTPLESIKEYMCGYFKILINDEDTRKFMEILRYKTEVKTDINEVLEVEQEIDLKIKEELSRLINLGIEAGEIRTDISKEIIAMSALSYLNGIEDSWLINPDEFSLEAHLDDLINLFIDGIVKKCCKSIIN
ncbi:transcriptional regulator, TetR family [Clostridium acidisoli DSM 12555]|uniref:Transcriptional regulator, TetR family n=1 Tax=Clostridium acidisoli DSM 12555 TaxID=1121291 RepID=A0A1W1XJM0_9CLOT|nr:TetR family transcriptional regulator [Clostridium acidisoli]SMC24180.1 transcriptional regulator, TetR family [Clostridium acidisoli DSM 12555]